ncbi:MAG: hypothetical protein SVU32_04785 [Candidatus Nanohaloarchaea archaeon]|nr:hypothetical protein [Candidatus Nanohaloarchaea archaeon]
MEKLKNAVWQVMCRVHGEQPLYRGSPKDDTVTQLLQDTDTVETLQARHGKTGETSYPADTDQGERTVEGDRAADTYNSRNAVDKDEVLEITWDPDSRTLSYAVKREWEDPDVEDRLSEHFKVEDRYRGKKQLENESPAEYLEDIGVN